MAYIYDLADVWAASGTTFTGIKLNVTDTASAAGSLLMDLQVGGVSKFKADKTANIGISGSVNTGAISLLSSANYTMTFDAGSQAVFFAVNNTSAGTAAISALGIRVGATSIFGWTSIANRADGTADLTLFRDAANTLAQRNGVNAQAFNLYNTYTDASNYERGFMRFVSNVLQIGTQKLGTGAARALEFQTDGTTRLTIATTGAATFSSTITIFGNEGFWGSGVLGLPGTGGQLKFSTNTVAVSGSGWDAGLARASSGVLKVTNGSTGTGQLIFIVPTTDPGITGALWNNLGVLSISA